MTDEFDALMGKVCQEDVSLLEHYRLLYHKNRPLLDQEGGSVKIPHVIHFIWLGPKPFPPESVENVRTWMALHPTWTFNFWTDRERAPPCRGMQEHFVKDFPFFLLRDHYERAENWGQKADILRYEILYQEGGLYIDHDASCLKSFEPLHRSYDLYCCLECPHPAHLGPRITAGIGLLGARAGHPVLQRCLHLVVEREKSIIHSTALKEQHFILQDTLSRTYLPFTYALQEAMDREGNCDIVLPAAYFYAKGDLPCLYSKHFYGASWLGGKNHSAESSMLKQVNQSKRFLNQGHLISLFTILLVLVIWLYVFVSKRFYSRAPRK